MDLTDFVHRLARRVAFEVIQRQPDQAGKNVQIESGIGAYANHCNDQPAGKAQ